MKKIDFTLYKNKKETHGDYYYIVIEEAESREGFYISLDPDYFQGLQESELHFYLDYKETLYFIHEQINNDNWNLTI